MENNIQKKIYLLVGYNRMLKVHFPTVNILGCYDNEEEIKKEQLEISGGEIKEVFSGSMAYYGKNNICTWITTLNLNERCKVNARQPQE